MTRTLRTPRDSGVPAALDDLRFRRMVERVHRLGPRVMCELLIELGATHLARHSIEAALERYGRLDPRALVATGGDRMPPAPVYEVPR